jgi:hypothetical protein
LLPEALADLVEQLLAVHRARKLARSANLDLMDLRRPGDDLDINVWPALSARVQRRLAVLPPVLVQVD